MKIANTLITFYVAWHIMNYLAEGTNLLFVALLLVILNLSGFIWGETMARKLSLTDIIKALL